jgi:hypothetical protein
MKWVSVLAIVTIGFIGVGVSTRPYSCFPRMTDQESLRPFERTLPMQPRHTVPFTAHQPAAFKEAAPIFNPKKSTADPVALGRIYYGYYCEMCHGAGGRGSGTVGRSYRPQPTLLATPAVTLLSGDDLARKMIRGKGHDPVLSATVASERRTFVAQYIKSLKPGPSNPAVRLYRGSLPGDIPNPFSAKD